VLKPRKRGCTVDDQSSGLGHELKAADDVSAKVWR
jgi:hypothetical protein